MSTADVSTAGTGLAPGADEAARTASRRANRSGWFINGARVLLLIIVWLLWWAAAANHWVSTLILPTPGATWHTLVTVSKNGTLFSNAGVTLEAAAIGFVIGMTAGVLIGFAVGLSLTLTGVVSPFIVVLNSLPRIALAPMFVLWFGVGNASGVALVVSLVFFIALTNTISGTQSVERSHLRLVQLYGANRLQITSKVVLPATVPWIVAAARLSLANALAGAIVSEMFLGQNGLGFMIVSGSGVFDTSQVFAAIIAALVIAAILDRIGTLLEKHLLRWRPSEV